MKKYNQPLFPFFLYLVLCITLKLNGQISVIGDLAYDINSTPGDVYRGQIAVVNLSDSTAGVNAYLTDYSFQAEGSNQYGDPGKMERSNANWITFSPQQMNIPANERMYINYEIHVPNSDSISGSYWSMMMVEDYKEPDPSILQQGVGINVKKRYGIQLAVHIDNDFSVRQVDISHPTLTKDNDDKQFTIDVKNTGNIFVRPTIWLELYNLKGRSLGTIEAELIRLYPATSHRFHFNLSKLPADTYKGIVVVDCGDDHLFGTNYTLNIE